MEDSLDKLYKNQGLIYKYILYVVTVGCIVFFFPKGGKFKYEFQKGKPWQYENLYAPFDFSIRKGEGEIAEEERAIRERQIPYYTYDTAVIEEVSRNFLADFQESLDGQQLSDGQKGRLTNIGEEVLADLYRNGILQKASARDAPDYLYLVRNNEASRIRADALYSLSQVDSVSKGILDSRRAGQFYPLYQEVFFNVLKPNVTYDAELSEKELADELSRISTTRGNVDEGKLIIARGEVVEAENLNILNSLKAEYESELWTENSQYFILFGYTILVALVLMMLFLFLQKYRPAIYRNNVKVTFIFFNVLLMVFLTTLVVKYDETYVY